MRHVKNHLKRSLITFMALFLAAMPALSLATMEPVSAAGAICSTSAPGAYYTASSFKGLGSLDTTLDASGSYGCDGHTIVGYSWDFGDGTTGSGVNVTHHYGLGTWNATLIVTDDAGQQGSATLSFIVKSSNTPPTASNYSASTPVDTQAKADLSSSASDPDGDSLTYSVASQPANGTATMWGTYFTYTPNSGFTGTDSFTYKVDDGFGGTATATVTVTVNPQPVANDDNVTTNMNQVVTISPLANDSYPSGTSPWISVGGNMSPPEGYINVDYSNNTVTFTPAPNFSGDFSFSLYP